MLVSLVPVTARPRTSSLPLSREHFWAMLLINFSKGLQGPENPTDRLRNGFYAFPLGQILYVPFALSRRVKELPTATVDDISPRLWL